VQYLHAEVFTAECKSFSVHNLKFIIKTFIFINPESEGLNSGRDEFLIEVPLCDVKRFAATKTYLLGQAENKTRGTARDFICNTSVPEWKIKHTDR
jgi:hypothetical protein